jgi:hypothetical protein
MQQVSPPKHNGYQDDWGDGREGYEDRGVFREARADSGGGGNLLKSVGGLAIVGGILWVTYLVATGGGIHDISNILQQNRGPVVVIALGAISSLLGKFLRF